MKNIKWLQFFATTNEEELKKQQTAAGADTGAQPAANTTGQTVSVTTQADAAGQANNAAQATPALYGGSYDSTISDLFTKITNTQPFSYDVNGDALYRQYKDQYTRNAQRSMQDTMGQAAALTGGYGSSYGQAAGQQAYDNTMAGLNDKVPELENQAYSRYQANLNQLNDQLNTAASLGAQEQATQQTNYSNLINMISSTGYKATPEELAAAGISQDQADILRFNWAYANPKALEAAVKAGQVTPEDYQALTGKKYGQTAGGGAGINTGNDYIQVTINGQTVLKPASEVQAGRKITVDGIVGNQTLGELDAMKASGEIQDYKIVRK